jgi:hypothetical protein
MFWAFQQVIGIAKVCGISSLGEGGCNNFGARPIDNLGTM